MCMCMYMYMYMYVTGLPADPTFCCFVSFVEAKRLKWKVNFVRQILKVSSMCFCFSPRRGAQSMLKVLVFDAQDLVGKRFALEVSIGS